MTTTRWIVLVLVVGGAGLAAWLASPPPATRESRDRAAIRGESVSAPAVSPKQSSESPVSPGAPTQVAAPARTGREGPSAKLVAELQAAKDWRAFALAARSRPAEGGYFYAMHVANICAMPAVAMPSLSREAIERAVAKTGTVSPTLLSMVDRLIQRCTSFAPGEAGELYHAVQQQTGDHRDPLINAIRTAAAALSAGDPRESKEALRSLLALDDPLVPYKDQLLVRVMSKATGTGKGDMWFDGRLYAADDGPALSALRTAIELAACSDSAPCEVDVLQVLGCIGGQFCTDDREAYLRNQYVETGASLEVYAQAVALSSRIREAVTRRQVERFFR